MTSTFDKIETEPVKGDSTIRTIHAQMTILILCPILVMLSAALSVGMKVMKPKLDSGGHQLLDKHGQPIFTVDEWATWKANALPNLLLYLALLFFLLSGLMFVKQCIRNRKDCKVTDDGDSDQVEQIFEQAVPPKSDRAGG